MPKSLSDFPLPLGWACLDRLRVEFILSSSEQPSLVLQPGAGAPTPGGGGTVAPGGAELRLSLQEQKDTPGSRIAAGGAAGQCC